MQYYYLDGLDKKGPYTKEELKGRNVTSETLVFSEGMENWKPIKDVTELNTYLFVTETKNENINEPILTDTPTQQEENVAEKSSLGFVTSFGTLIRLVF